MTTLNSLGGADPEPAEVFGRVVGDGRLRRQGRGLCDRTGVAGGRRAVPRPDAGVSTQATRLAIVATDLRWRPTMRRARARAVASRLRRGRRPAY